MSAWTIVFLSIAVYLVGGIGTARVVFARKYKTAHPEWVREKADLRALGTTYMTTRDMRIKQNDPHYLTVHDPSVFGPTVWAGLFWPFALVYLLLIRPVGTVLVPLSVKWFMAPARKGVAS